MDGIVQGYSCGTAASPSDCYTECNCQRNGPAPAPGAPAATAVNCSIFSYVPAGGDTAGRCKAGESLCLKIYHNPEVADQGSLITNTSNIASPGAFTGPMVWLANSDFQSE